MTKDIPAVSFPASDSRRLGLLMSDAEQQRTIKQWAEEDHSKLQLLCQHYGIHAGPTMYYELALALARQLCPEPRKPGAKSKWTALNKGALVVEIDRLVKPDDPTHGVTWAAKKLANREPWKSFLKRNESDKETANPVEVLRTTYYRFKADKWARMSWKAFLWHEHEGTIDDWDSLVADVVRNPKPD